MDEPPPEKKRTKSDVIAHATVQEFVMSHTKPNGGFRGFLHSNLFAALIIWALSQAVIVVGVVITFYMKTTQLSEWKGKTEATLARMDEQGTVHSHYEVQQLDRRVTQNEEKIDKLQEITKHSEVNEFEVRQLRKEVEDLRNGKK